jgi:hypothetical protein
MLAGSSSGGEIDIPTGTLEFSQSPGFMHHNPWDWQVRPDFEEPHLPAAIERLQDRLREYAHQARRKKQDVLDQAVHEFLRREGY